MVVDIMSYNKYVKISRKPKRTKQRCGRRAKKIFSYEIESFKRT